MTKMNDWEVPECSAERASTTGESAHFTLPKDPKNGASGKPRKLTGMLCFWGSLRSRGETDFPQAGPSILMGGN